MRHRYFLLALAFLLPALAQAQDKCPVPGVLTILSPSSIAGEYDAATPSGDGSWADTTGLIPPGATEVVVHVQDNGTDPGEACVPLTNASEVAGHIAFIRRGECEFGLKAQHAQEAGAIGFLIYNDERVPNDDTTILDPPFMGGGANGINVTIPGLFVSRATGLAIFDELKFGDVEVNLAYQECWVSTPIEPGPDGRPGTHALTDARPNPSRGRAAFTLEVAEVQDVTVEVYNMIGQRVAVLHEGMLVPGIEHAFTFDGAHLPNGVYLYRALGEVFNETRSLILMR